MAQTRSRPCESARGSKRSMPGVSLIWKMRSGTASVRPGVQEGLELAPALRERPPRGRAADDLEAQPIRILEECCVVLHVVFRIELRRRCGDAERRQRPVRGVDV